MGELIDMKIEMIGLSGFSTPNSQSNYQGGQEFGQLKVAKDEPRASLEFHKDAKDPSIIIHPILGEVPHYKAVIYDMCIKAYEILIMRIENYI